MTTEGDRDHANTLPGWCTIGVVGWWVIMGLRRGARHQALFGFIQFVDETQGLFAPEASGQGCNQGTCGISPSPRSLIRGVLAYLRKLSQGPPPAGTACTACRTVTRCCVSSALQWPCPYLPAKYPESASERPGMRQVSLAAAAVHFSQHGGTACSTHRGLYP